MDPRCNDDKLLIRASKTGLPILSLDYHGHGARVPVSVRPERMLRCLHDSYEEQGAVHRALREGGAQDRDHGRQCGRHPGDLHDPDDYREWLVPGLSISGPDGSARPVWPDPLPPQPGHEHGNRMSDEQMASIKDRRSRGTNKRIVQRKSMQYNDLVGTPHQSDDEDDPSPKPLDGDTDPNTSGFSPYARSPVPEFSHSRPFHLEQADPDAPHRGGVRRSESPRQRVAPPCAAANPSRHEQQDLVLQRPCPHARDDARHDHPLYIGPHNRPDFASDYLLCPILAPDVLLARFLKTYFLTGERDSLVDDTVIFSGRLRRAKAAMHASGGTRLEYLDRDANVAGFDEKSVAEVALLPGVSHGFLQFPTIYPPAWKLMDRAARWIDDAFESARRRERERQRRR